MAPQNILRAISVLTLGNKVKLYCVSVIQAHERFKRTLFIRTRQNQQIFGLVPFIKLQNDS